MLVYMHGTLNLNNLLFYQFGHKIIIDELLRINLNLIVINGACHHVVLRCQAFDTTSLTKSVSTWKNYRKVVS